MPIPHEGRDRQLRFQLDEFIRNWTLDTFWGRRLQAWWGLGCESCESLGGTVGGKGTGYSQYAGKDSHGIGMIDSSSIPLDSRTPSCDTGEIDEWRNSDHFLMNSCHEEVPILSYRLQ
eukprot:gene18774-biopygen5636